jgi:colicin import membrane protein
MMTYHEPGRLRAGALALLVHLGFLALLVFGVSWQTQKAEPIVVDLWSSLPERPAAVRPLPPPPRPKAPEPEPAKPQPRPEPRIEPAKPDILLKERERKEKLKQEEQHKRQAEEEKIRQQELQAELARQAEQQRQQLEQQALQQQLQAQQTARQNSVVDEYRRRIQEKIKSRINTPPDLKGNPQAEFDVIVLPGGTIWRVALTRSSGQPAYDNAVENAIRKSEPLPLPPDQALFNKFRELHLKFRPNE